MVQPKSHSPIPFEAGLMAGAQNCALARGSNPSVELFMGHAKLEVYESGCFGYGCRRVPREPYP